MLTVAAMRGMARSNKTESHIVSMAGLPKKPRTEDAAGPSQNGGSTFRAWSPPRPTFDELASDEVPSTSGRQERAWSPPRPPSGRGEGAWSPPRPPGAEEKEGMCWLVNSWLSTYFEDKHSGERLQETNTQTRSAVKREEERTKQGAHFQRSGRSRPLSTVYCNS
jgi:hypothetical protein